MPNGGCKAQAKECLWYGKAELCHQTMLGCGWNAIALEHAIDGNGNEIVDFHKLPARSGKECMK